MNSDVPWYVRRRLRQKAVYWPFVGNDAQGRPKYGNGVEVRCHWEDRNDAYTDKNGAVAVSRSVILVDRDMTRQGVIALGELSSFSYPNDPFKNKDDQGNARAWPILKYDRSPTSRGDQFERTVII